MAVTSAAITSAIMAANQGIYPGSQTLPRIAAAVGRSLTTWLPVPSNVLARGVSIGVVGAGSVNGKLFVTGGAVFVVNGLRQAGMSGVTATGLGTAIGIGVSTALNASAQYSGFSIGVGFGVDSSQVSLVNSSTLTSILLANLTGAGVRGQQAPQLATGLGRGIANLVRTGFGRGLVVGSPSPISTVGTSINTVF